MNSNRLAIIEDDPVMGASLVSHFKGLGFLPSWYMCGEDALSGLERTHGADIVITDIRLPDVSGEEVFYTLRSRFPNTPCIMITAFGSVEQAVRLIKEGLEDYIIKPFDVGDLVRKIEHLIKRQREERLARQLMDDLSDRLGKGEVVAGISPQMREIEQLIKKVSNLPTSILLTGETGVGKEVVANLCHYCGTRADKPFVALHCAALPPSLLESELFGHEKGAFTGAVKAKPGKFELAHEGTLFLDEIGEVSPDIQVKLLRVLQERRLERVGGTKAIDIDMRLIAATSRDINELVETGEFRRDLLYRINVVPIHIPPLRERPDDILFFADYFLRFFSRELKKPLKKLSPRSEGALLAYDFPGNVRELRNLIERAMALSERQVLGPDDIFQVGSGKKRQGEPPAMLRTAVAETERCLISRTLEETDNAVGKAAKLLGISRKTLWEKMKRYGIETEHSMHDD